MVTVPFTKLKSDHLSAQISSLRTPRHTQAMIACILGAGRRMLLGAGQAMQANAGVDTPTVIGCNVPPGIYTARWDKGRLKVHHEENGKSKETAFAVLSSAPTKR